MQVLLLTEGFPHHSRRKFQRKISMKKSSCICIHTQVKPTRNTASDSDPSTHGAPCASLVRDILDINTSPGRQQQAQQDTAQTSQPAPHWGFLPANTFVFSLTLMRVSIKVCFLWAGRRTHLNKYKIYHWFELSPVFTEKAAIAFTLESTHDLGTPGFKIFPHPVAAERPGQGQMSTKGWV